MQCQAHRGCSRLVGAKVALQKCAQWLMLAEWTDMRASDVEVKKAKDKHLGLPPISEL